jgi:hypothetical protein
LALGLAVPAGLVVRAVVLALPVLAMLALAVLDVAEPTPTSRVATLFSQATPRRVAMNEDEISWQ